MNQLVMPMHKLARIVAFLSLPLLASCDEPASPPPLEGAAIGGPFELVNPAGETVRWNDFEGQYRMVYFGYAWCPDVCPFDLNRMMRGYAQFAESEPDLAAQVQPIFITVDPKRDTPDKVGEYVANFGDNLIGLTGTPEQVDQAAMNFSVYYSRGPDDSTYGYLVDHSRAGYLMGRSGEPIALLPVDESPEGVAAELEKWVH